MTTELATLDITVLGKPATGGNKTGFPVHRANGEIGVAMREGRTKKSAEHAKLWRSIVQDRVGEVWGNHPLIDGPCALYLIFYQRRPASHFGTGRNAGKLKASAPERPIGKPDALKLARAVEDALKGVIYTDDSRVTDGGQTKRYGVRDCCRIILIVGGTLDDCLTQAWDHGGELVLRLGGSDGSE